MTNWDDYDPYEPPHHGPLAELGRKEAQESFDRLMASRAERRRQLHALIGSDSALGDDDASVQRLNDWFRSNVELGDDGERLRNLSYAVINDVALHLGDVLIRRRPVLHWEMLTAGKKDPAYQKHVITGFGRAPDPTFALDIDSLLVAHAYQVVDKNDPDENEFVAVLHAAESIA